MTRLRRTIRGQRNGARGICLKRSRHGTGLARELAPVRDVELSRAGERRGKRCSVPDQYSLFPRLQQGAGRLRISVVGGEEDAVARSGIAVVTRQGADRARRPFFQGGPFVTASTP